ncbi:iron-sulfur cluster repair di-iron protein [Parapedobacter koreensis]|uniref:Regulator of cell morphogenesis and NO signaling n=1 Tax=Parapedobacter koreensis TaxID=332977 RepID=A0A1H7RI83_9SPHI|nr:iron-sulfur cluster repair di-iron protein [Parapedobacter koreensis]SEL59946.1 regulator of cell morphogenesis and NO signaling [Parapedobacter koreensis]
MIKTALLNVTRIEPRLKHPTIFEHFDALEPGEAFVILNDHDPKPLYYQLLGERGNFFTWEYLEAGPEWWRVRIAKPVAETHEETVGEIAAKDLRKAKVFKKLGIDFCCGGKQTLKEATDAVGLDEQLVRQELEHAAEIKTEQAGHDFDRWNPGFLADYICNVHHRYIREQGPIIEQLADKVALRHGVEHHELLALAEGVHAFMADLYSHIQKEEQTLFPIIKKLEVGAEDVSLQASEVVKCMEDEHESAGGELRRFRTLTRDYQLPANACNSYTYLYDRIKAFENDLFQHIHLENNILFPKTITLEKERLAHG